jgi:hypothetical protein
MKILAAMIWSMLSAPAFVYGGSLAGNYTDPAYLNDQGFNINSQWIYPARSYLQTVPASTFINGVGINWNGTQNVNVVGQMLSNYGFKSVRIEVEWSALDYATESVFPASVQTQLQAAAAYGLRPLLLLNANEVAPCPYLTLHHTVSVAAAAGAIQVTLDSTADIVPGYSGFTNLTGSYVMCEALVTSVSGNTVTLSKPLPVAFSSGQSVSMNTLKYRPFDTPLDPLYNATTATASLNGWNNYALKLATLAAGIMGPIGFDMEIWNELSFGSKFLALCNYYGTPPPPDAQDIWATIVSNTASTATANPAAFSGVRLTDGFANTVPWPASSNEPARIGGISKHPYPIYSAYPIGQQQIPGGWMLNGLLLADNYTFVPAYMIYMPEYYGTSIQTETVIRDMAPINNGIYGVWHGANYRPGNPCPVFITEIGVQPAQVGITDTPSALLMKAKAASRMLCFFLNKGAAVVNLYSVSSSGDLDWQILLDSFLQYAANNTTYPSPDSGYVSPALKLISAIADQMSCGLDPTLTLANTTPLSVVSIADTHDHNQFSGDGTPAHPNGYDREAFQFLPFQVNHTRFVIPYYVMTRNITQALTPESFEIQVKGFCKCASIQSFDPLNNVYMSVQSKYLGHGVTDITLAATDYPYLLIVNQ